jgi:hypothetical protein
MALTVLILSRLGPLGRAALVALIPWPGSSLSHNCHVSALALGAKAHCNKKLVVLPNLGCLATYIGDAL